MRDQGLPDNSIPIAAENRLAADCEWQNLNWTSSLIAAGIRSGDWRQPTPRVSGQQNCRS
jgi:hypothetical protein